MESGNFGAFAAIISQLSPLLSRSRLSAALSQKQRHIVGGLWITYALFYLGRVNLSVVLPLLALELSVSRAEIGILGSVFFWVYGIGNVICGELGSRVSPHRVIGLGLLASAIVNLAFGFGSSLVFMLLVWAVNGLAQSGGWSPMMRIIAERLDASQAKRVSTMMPFSYVVGTAITWTVIGALATGDNWRLAFWLPGLVLLVSALLWWRAGIDAPKTSGTGLRLSALVAEARGLSFALLVAALAGFVRNGSIIWLPAYILDTGLFADHLAGLVAALTQVIAFAGIFLARQLVMRSDKVLLTALLMLAAAGFAFLLLTLSGALLSVIVISFALMMLNGAFGLVTSSMPLLLAGPGRASSIAGTLNMMATVAGGLAGFSVGGLVELSGWGAVFGLWGVMLLLAGLVIWLKRGEE